MYEVIHSQSINKFTPDYLKTIKNIFNNPRVEKTCRNSTNAKV